MDTTPHGVHRLRRFGAIVYDSLLLFAVLFFATIPVLAVTGGRPVPAAHPLYTAYLAGVSFLYFGWFWTHGGQTLGMKAWRIRVSSRHGGPVRWRQALLRFLAALVSWAALGIGFACSAIDRDGQAWHDRWSDTVLRLMPRSL